MKKRLFIQNAALLTATALLLRVAGMGFRIYIAGQIGDEGMGLYQLIFTLYNLGITIATTGVSVASTRMVTEWLASETKSPKALAARVLRYSVFVGAVAGTVLFFAAQPACLYLLKDARAILPLKILAPSLPFMAAGASLRGCFAACRNVKSASGSQIFEQIIRIGIVAVLLPRLLPFGLSLACAAIMVGTTVSELLSALYMLWSWKHYLRQRVDAPCAPPPHALSRYSSISAPITATRGIGSLLVAIENMLVPLCLATALGSATAALAAFGQLKAMAMPLLFFPFSFLSTISTLMLPEITETHTRGDAAGLARLIETTLLLTAVVAVLMSGVFTIFSQDLGKALYHSNEIGFYLCVLGPLMPTMYLESMVDGILRGLGEQLATFRYSICDSCLRILGTLLLVPHFGMAGFLFVMFYSNLFTCTLNIARLLRVAKLSFCWKNWLIKPIFSIFCGYLSYRFVLLPLLGGRFVLLVRMVCGMATVSATYLVFLWLSGAVTKEQFAFMGLKVKRESARSCD
ncbi:MAG: oligosaccharide flippase family protein [Pygmaiobacter sp.]